MPKPLFHDEQHLLGRFDHQQALGLKPNQGKRWGKKIAIPGYPKYWAANPSGEAADHERGRGALLGIRPGACHLVQGAQCQPSSGQALVDRFYSERQRPGCHSGRAGTFQA